MKNLPSKRGSRDCLAREHTCQSSVIEFVNLRTNRDSRVPMILDVIGQTRRFRTAITTLSRLRKEVRERPLYKECFRYGQHCAVEGYQSVQPKYGVACKPKLLESLVSAHLQIAGPYPGCSLSSLLL